MSPILVHTFRRNQTVFQPMTFPMPIGTFSQLNYGPTNSPVSLCVTSAPKSDICPTVDLSPPLAGDVLPTELRPHGISQ